MVNVSGLCCFSNFVLALGLTDDQTLTRELEEAHEILSSVTGIILHTMLNSYFVISTQWFSKQLDFCKYSFCPGSSPCCERCRGLCRSTLQESTLLLPN